MGNGEPIQRQIIPGKRIKRLFNLQEKSHVMHMKKVNTSLDNFTVSSEGYISLVRMYANSNLVSPDAPLLQLYTEENDSKSVSRIQ